MEDEDGIANKVRILMFQVFSCTGSAQPSLPLGLSGVGIATLGVSLGPGSRR